MDWFAALVTRANGNAALTALIGANKVFPEQAPQKTSRPYVTLFVPSGVRPQTMNDWDLEETRVQIDVWADSYSQKNAVMEAVLNAIVPGGTFGGHKFQRADVVLAPRDITGETDGTNPVFRKSADLIINHTTA